MKRSYWTGVLCILTTFTSAQTNLITNGSFENSWQTPVCWGQAHFATNWQSQYTHEVNDGDVDWYNHSPDYYDENINLYSQSICSGEFGSSGGFVKYASGAHSGNRFVGMGSYELLEQLLNQELIPGEHYTLSMYVALTDENPSDWIGNYELTLGVAKNEVKYVSATGFEECESSYGEYQDGPSQEIFIVGRLPLTIADYPPANGWQRITVGFRAPESGLGNHVWDWVFMDVRSTSDDWNGERCSGDYIFIDDVSLSRSEFCGSICSPELGPISYWRYVNNVMTYGNPPTGVIVGGSAGQSFYMYVTNAIGIDFTVFGSNSQIIYERHAFDPKGLKDEFYPDYWFTWNGEDESGNFIYPGEDVFVYSLKMWNCNPGNTIEYLGNELVYTPSNLDNVDFGEIVRYELEDCCEENKYHQNIVFTGLQRTDVHDFITAGSNVTLGPTGPVIVSSLSVVYFRAGQVINLEPGFSVQTGGVFNGIISDCVYGNAKSMRSIRRTVIEENDRSMIASHAFTVWPTFIQSGSCTLEFGKSLTSHCAEFTISTYDAYGRECGTDQITVIEGAQRYPLQVPPSAHGVVLLVLRDCWGYVVGTERVVVP